MDKIDKLLTKQETEIKEILLKCKSDPAFFISTFCVRPDDLNCKINVYERKKQLEIIENFLVSHNLIINSSRQVGKTTLVEALILWLVLFHYNYTVSILTKNADFTAKIINEIMIIYENLPLFFRKVFKLKVDNVRTKVFTNYSRIESIIVEKSKPEAAGRGARGGFVFIDEAAFIEYMDDVFAAIQPITTSIQKNYAEKGYPYGTIISSTPNGTEGVGRWYYTFWNSALDGLVDFVPIVFHWKDAGYTENEMFKMRRKINNELKYMQEYELVFLVGQSSLLDVDIATKLQHMSNSPVEVIYLKHNMKLELYDKLKKDSQYIISVDTASETGTSDQAILICEYTSDGLVKAIGESYNKIPIMSFAENIVMVTELFKSNNYFLIIEKNYLGDAVIDYLKKHHEHIYNKLYTYKEKKNDKVKVMKGIQTNTKTKNLMIDAFSQYLNENREELIELILPSMLKRQILSLQYNRTNSRLVVPRGMKDDLIMCFSFVLYLKYFDTVNFNHHITISKMSDGKLLEDTYKKALSFYNERYG